MKRSLLHVAGLLFNRPHAITPSKLEVIKGVFLSSLNDRTPLAFWDDDDDDDGPQKPDDNDFPFDVTPDGIAIIPIDGTLVRRASGMDAMSGLQSYNSIAESFN